MDIDTKNCPNIKDHVQHYWRFSDELFGEIHKCNGYLNVEVDVLERPVNGA